MIKTDISKTVLLHIKPMKVKKLSGWYSLNWAKP